MLWFYRCFCAVLFLILNNDAGGGISFIVQTEYSQANNANNSLIPSSYLLRNSGKRLFVPASQFWKCNPFICFVPGFNKCLWFGVVAWTKQSLVWTIWWTFSTIFDHKNNYNIKWKWPFLLLLVLLLYIVLLLVINSYFFPYAFSLRSCSICLCDGAEASEGLQTTHLPWNLPICLSVWLSTGMTVCPCVIHVPLIKLWKSRAGAGCSVKVEAIDRETPLSV